MLDNYSITPLYEDHFEERCQAIVRDVRCGAYTMPMFSMTLVPEGNPVWDKVGPLAEIYARYRDRLAEQGIETAVLVQASLGHGYPIEPNPFTKYVNFCDGAEVGVCCPLDPAFLEHFQGVLRRIAKERPTAIMLDDDFRLIHRRGMGCACHRHMADFNRRAGVNMTRAELWEHIGKNGKRDPLARIYTETQHDALVGAARAFRAAVDSVDPSIRGINCTSGHLCEAVDKTAPIWCGEGNPTTVRVPNGCYAPHSVREFSEGMRQAAICGDRLRRRGIERILAETDTIPFNRYAKSARYLHAHFASSILEGLCGAKHWLTRTSAYEPDSGKAYRAILSKHSRLYERLSALAPHLTPVGLGVLYADGNDFDYHGADPGRLSTHTIVTKTLERMGLPFYFTSGAGAVRYAEGTVLDELSDSELEALLSSGSLLVDGDSADILAERGFASAMGVEPRHWDLGPRASETYDGTDSMCSTAQKYKRRLVPTDPALEVLSYNCRNNDGELELLAPAVTLLPRKEGGAVGVFCGTANAPFTYGEGFAFLNESRKRQLVSILARLGGLPMYCVGDDEVCLRVSEVDDGRLFAAIYLLGVDPIEEPRIYLEKPATEITYLDPDGNEQPLAFTAEEGGIYRLDTRIEALYPLFLFIK